MVLSRSIRDYSDNLNVVALFSVLLILSLLSVFLPGTFLSSGSAFLRISEVGTAFNLALFAIPLVYTFLIIAATSLLLSVLVVRIKDDRLNVFAQEDEVTEAVMFSTTNLVVFFSFITLLSLALNFLFAAAGVPVIVAQALIMLVYLPFLFAPVSLIIDDHSFMDSILESIRYMRSFPLNTLKFVGLALSAVFVSGLLNFAFDQFFFLGKYVSLIVNTYVFLPGLIIVQTNLYLKKFGLLID